MNPDPSSVRLTLDMVYDLIEFLEDFEDGAPDASARSKRATRLLAELRAL